MFDNGGRWVRRRVVDGKAVEFRGTADDLYAEDAFWD
jgi:hypothetical protein